MFFILLFWLCKAFDFFYATLDDAVGEVFRILALWVSTSNQDIHAAFEPFVQNSRNFHDFV